MTNHKQRTGTLSDTGASITRLLDEAAVRDSTARFADILMRADYDAFGALGPTTPNG